MEPAAIRIVRAIERPLGSVDAAAIDRIFFASSATRQFADEAERERFRERWLGRYLKHDAAYAFFAVAPHDAIVGYIVGSIDDPARTARFADIAYFRQLAALTARYPAHLHINVDDAYRNCGLGARLVSAFLAQARLGGAIGAHVVTGRDSRNVRFYQRNGFVEVAQLTVDGRPIVMLARDI